MANHFFYVLVFAYGQNRAKNLPHNGRGRGRDGGSLGHAGISNSQGRRQTASQQMDREIKQSDDGCDTIRFIGDKVEIPPVDIAQENRLYLDLSVQIGKVFKCSDGSRVLRS